MASPVLCAKHSSDERTYLWGQTDPAPYALSDARQRWGSCGREGVIRVHWQPVQAPTAAFECVVAHELAHLAHRNHAPAFWATLARLLPDWVERKAMLERWEGERWEGERRGV